MERVVAVTMVKDEMDVLPFVLRHMIDQVDHVIVSDNGSTDGTLDWLLWFEDEYPEQCTVVTDPEPAYFQSAKMTRLAELARTRFHAEWIVPFDADEWWYSSFYPRLADAFMGFKVYDIVQAQLHDHVTTDADPDDKDPTKRIGWRRIDPVPLPKVAVRWHAGLVIEQGNHGAHYDGLSDWSTSPQPFLAVRHFPYRSEEQFVRKARNGSTAYRAGGDRIPAKFGVHWREWGDLLDAHGDEALIEVYRTWYHSPAPGLDHTLIYDPAP